MKETFEPTLKAHVLRDNNGRARTIRHTQKHWASEQGSPVEAALDYVREMAATTWIPRSPSPTTVCGPARLHELGQDAPRLLRHPNQDVEKTQVKEIIVGFRIREKRSE